MKMPPFPSPFARFGRTLAAGPLLLVLQAATLSAASFYVAPTGSDSASGSQTAPFRSLTKAQSAASSGDTVFVRGGTYRGFAIAGSDANYNFVHDITKSGITYSAFPGETPIFDFTGTTTAKRVAGFHVASGASVTFRGLTITGVPVGSQKQSECFRIQGTATFDRVTCHGNAATGFYFTTHGTGSCTNCDSYDNIGGTTAADENTDGFGAHGDAVTFRFCRAWNCSDDGYDCINSNGPVTIDHCWAYNINAAGNGNGFKGGGNGTPPPTVPSHTIMYCLSANNKASGFYANHHPGKAADWTHNTAYNNRNSNFNMLERRSTSDATDIPGTREVLHFNIAFTGTTISNSDLPAANLTNNSWTKSGVTVTAADFQSLDASQVMRPRNADGSLPTITFMHLVPGSDLAGLGCFDAETPPPAAVTYQAESALLTGGAAAETTNTGFHGAGYVNFPMSGGTLALNNVGSAGGSKTLVVRFALGATTARTGQLTVNGSTTAITFQPTGSWTTWQTLNVTVALNNSATNTIGITSTGSDLANIDEITVP